MLRKSYLTHPEWIVDAVLGRCICMPSDTVVITGFWRSGTTWSLQTLSESMHAKCVYEPFHYSIESYQDAIYGTLKGSGIEADKGYLNMFMPYTENFGDSLLKEYSLRALTSRVPDSWIRKPRRGRNSEGLATRRLKRIRDALQTRIVAKFVRAHLLIPALREWFDPVTVHVRRDPRAVVASFTRNWQIHHSLSLEKQLLQPKDGRAHYFQAWSDEIKDIDKRDPTTRLAAYWALVEQFVWDLPDHSRHVSLRYEDLCLEGEKYIQRKLSPLLRQAFSIKQLDRSSINTHAGRHGISSKKRAYGWKNELSLETISKIEGVINHLGLVHLLK